ncbi:solute carrier family 15 member 1-like [Panonychus citri]|uniref:solute carrier family 15 member 1-like n=1 Tax=Panonychus citri TaxID=50023 RepID=UPI002307A9E4|nr:solute carrier family 15 member 1-like [Panonychus citri]
MNNEKKSDAEASSNSVNLKYPRSVFFIIGNEFCERFCFYGMKAVLVLYFTKVLKQTEDSATQSYHEFILLCYFTPLIGAILADSYLGKFKTILYLSLLYVAGNIALSASSYIENSLLSIFSLGLIAFGTGGIKPCVSAFGGDQFVAGQEDQLNKFFAIFYMSINMGSLFSTFITPILRSDVSCSSRGDCFPLAFGVPAALMTIALILFIAGKPAYRIVEVAKGNVIFKFFQCNAYAFGLKFQSLFTSKKGLEKREHWLDYAEDKYSPKLINEVKTVNRVLFLYLPLPLFWALFDQQGSRWTLQALKMDGILFGETALKPDQLQVINPILIVAMIPIFQYIVYPITDKLGIVKTPLQRMAIGGILAGVAFLLAALLQISIESEVPKSISVGFGAITFINSLPCAITLISVNQSNPMRFPLESGSAFLVPKSLPVGSYIFNVETNTKDSECQFNDNSTITLKPIDFVIQNRARDVIQLIARENDQGYALDAIEITHHLIKPDQGDSAIQVAHYLSNSANVNVNTSNNQQSIVFSKSSQGSSKDPKIYLNTSFGLSEYVKVETFSGIETYQVLPKGFDNGSISGHSIKVRNGAFYILVVIQDPTSGQINYKLNKVVDENRISMLWQIPQYFVITCGEVMFSVTGLEFSYSQAPNSMKSVVQAAWLLTVSFGNFFVALITKYIKFEAQSIEFFFFAGLMICDMIIFAIMSYLYTYSNQALDDGPSKTSTATSNGSNGSTLTNGNGHSSQEKSNELQDTKL